MEGRTTQVVMAYGTRALALLLALALSISQASSGMLLNPFGFGVSLVFQQCATDLSALTTYTFSSQNVGTAENNRGTIVAVMAIDGASAFGVNSVTVGGASATEVIDENGTGEVDSALYIVDNPAGTSEDIVVTMSEAIEVIEVCVWAAYGLNSNTAVASTADDDTAAGELDLDLSGTTTGGIAVAGCGTKTTPQTPTWTGLAQVNGGDRSAAQMAPTAGGSLSVRCDYTGSGDTTGVAASFR